MHSNIDAYCKDKTPEAQRARMEKGDKSAIKVLAGRS